MKKIISTNKAPAAIGPYVQATAVGNMLYTSGQLGMDLQTNLVVGGVAAQTKKALENLQAVLEEAGSSMEKVVKTVVFLADINDFAEVNKIYSTFFSHNPPSRSAVEVAALPKGALVEIEAIAII